MSLPKRREDPPPPELLRAAVLSVVLVGLFSLLDLVWSLLAWRAGQLRELNPLASGLIEDPRWLIAFKGLTTLASCLTLVLLRRHYIARLAAWWLCLACTILTFRWLMFNSMFLGS